MKLRICLLVFIVLCLNSLGILALSSASIVVVNRSFVHRQLVAQVIALLACVCCFKIHIHVLYKWKNIFFVGAIIALILVLLPCLGRTVNGSRRWISISGFNFQVSEFAKIAMVIWTAGYIRDHALKIHTFIDGWIIPICVCCCFSLFIILEPDYGTTFLVIVTVSLMLYLCGMNWKYLLYFGICGGFIFLFLIYLSPIRFRRITSFFFVEEHRFDATYQLWQSLLCFASGGKWGAGVGLSRQKLAYLPEAHTDFIFPIIGEEFGVIFSISVLVLFCLFMVISMSGLMMKKDPFVRALGYGSTMIITFQALINTAMVSGCCPTKGMALPFISYGGSNLIAMYILFGIIINCLHTEDADVHFPCYRIGLEKV